MGEEDEREGRNLSVPMRLAFDTHKFFRSLRANLLFELFELLGVEGIIPAKIDKDLHAAIEL